jgi:hypothetical protein
MSQAITLTTGSLILYRAYDVAEEIRLNEVEQILKSQNLSATAEGPLKRLTLTRPTRNALIIRNPPVQIGLGPVLIQLRGMDFNAEVVAKIWEYGTVTLAFQIQLPANTPIDELPAWSESIQNLESIDQIAWNKTSELTQLLKPALESPSYWHVSEDYYIIFLEKFNVSANEAIRALKNGPLPEIILGEPKEILAAHTRQNILESTFQYSESDLAVIDWNAALLVEPSASRDVTDILEFALTHLLEFRYFDHLLDQRLAELYDALGKERQTLFKNHFAKLLNESNQRYIEISEFIERVDNSLKVVGDFYLGVLFREAIGQFRIGDWQKTVTRKNNALAQISQLLEGELNVHRGHTLELIVIGLIAFEVVSAIVKNVH